MEMTEASDVPPPSEAQDPPPQPDDPPLDGPVGDEEIAKAIGYLLDLDDPRHDVWFRQMVEDSSNEARHELHFKRHSSIPIVRRELSYTVGWMATLTGERLAGTLQRLFRNDGGWNLARTVIDYREKYEEFKNEFLQGTARPA